MIRREGIIQIANFCKTQKVDHPWVRRPFVKTNSSQGFFPDSLRANCFADPNYGICAHPLLVLPILELPDHPRDEVRMHSTVGNLASSGLPRRGSSQRRARSAPPIQQSVPQLQPAGHAGRLLTSPLTQPSQPKHADLGSPDFLGAIQPYLLLSYTRFCSRKTVSS